MIKFSCIILAVFVINNSFGRVIVQNIMTFVTKNLQLTRFDIYSAENFSYLNNNLFIMNYFIFAICNFFIFDYENNKIKNLILLQAIGTSLLAFTTTLGEFYRLGYFFIIYSILLIPEIVSLFQKKNTRFLARFGIVTLGTLYFLLFSAKNNKIIPYIPYWKELL